MRRDIGLIGLPVRYLIISVRGIELSADGHAIGGSGTGMGDGPAGESAGV